jgi:hypothetical protein
VKTLRIINRNTLIYQKLQRKFCTTPLSYVIQHHLHEARKLFHWLHPFLDIWKQLSYREITLAQNLSQSAARPSMHFSSIRLLTLRDIKIWACCSTGVPWMKVNTHNGLHMPQIDLIHFILVELTNKCTMFLFYVYFHFSPTCFGIYMPFPRWSILST